MFALGIPEIIIFALLLAILVFEVFMFVDMLKNPDIADNTRIFWAVGMLIFHPFVAIYYYFTEYRKI